MQTVKTRQHKVHARAAVKLVELAQSFEAVITIDNEEDKKDAIIMSYLFF